jgi:hypothetical protein
MGLHYISQIEDKGKDIIACPHGWLDYCWQMAASSQALASTVSTKIGVGPYRWPGPEAQTPLTIMRPI